MSIKTNRLLVGFLGIPGILLLIWLGGIWFTILVTVAILLASFEYYQLVKSKQIYPLTFVGLFVALVIIYFYYSEQHISGFIIYALCILFILFLLIVELFREKSNPIMNFTTTLGGILYIPLLLGSLIGIRNFDSTYSTNFTFALFISIWICDSAAYYAGKLWGKKKIYPRVSPNKTVAGSVAGVIGAFLAYLIMAKSGFIRFDLDLFQIILLTIISGVFGQIGDFVESLFKRDAQVKDSGVILLGHGGVLDRFDSLIIASPLVFIFLNLYY